MDKAHATPGPGPARETDEALRASEARLSAVIANSPGVAVQWYDPSGRVVLWNRASEEMFGFTEAQAMGRTLDQLIHTPEEFAAFKTALATITATGKPIGPGEYAFKRKNGAPGVCLSTIFSIPGAAGEPWFVCMDVDVTAAKQIEESLRESREFIEKVAGTSPHWIYVFDLDEQRLTYANRPVLVELGHEPSAAAAAGLLAGFQEYMPPDEMPHLASLLREWGEMRPGRIREDRYRLRHADGSDHWFLGREAVFSVHPDGSARQILGTLFDITEQRRAEETIQDILDAIAPITGQDFFEALANQLCRACEVGHALVGALDPEDPDVLNTIAVSCDSQVAGNFDYPLRETPFGRIEGSDPVYYPSEVRKTFPADPLLKRHGIDSCMGILLYSSDGPCLGLIALLDDHPLRDPRQAETMLRVVAARAAAELQREVSERARREAESRHRAIFESSQDGLVVMDAEGDIVEFNQAAESIFGRRREAVIGTSLAERLVPPEAREAHQQGLRRYVETGDRSIMGRRVEMSAQRADGAIFPIELTIVPVPGVDPPIFAGVVRDISERNRMEEKLRQSQKLQAIGQLAGGIAHDFNNLLTVINGNSDLLLGQMEAGNPERESVAAILDAGERAARLTRQLLLFSRTALLEPRPLDLGESLQRSGTLLRRLIGEDVELTVTLAPRLGAILADPGQIEQLVLNLSLNARDAMPRGGRLTIETTNVDCDEEACRTHVGARPGPYVRLDVSDSGSGMTPDVRAHIFEPFFTTKGSGKGTGLGLATVYGIVRQCDGFITVDSTVGTGTTFSVYFPVTDQEVAGDAAESPHLDSLRGQETILLVEDEEGVRRFARQTLESYGYAVLEAADGRAALDLVAKEAGPISLLITDVVMPEMSGTQLAEKLRSIRQGIPVIYMSGYANEAVARGGIATTDDGFLQKPFTAQVLALKVREILSAGV